MSMLIPNFRKEHKLVDDSVIDNAPMAEQMTPAAPQNNQEASWYEGMGDAAWRGLKASGAKTASALLGGVSQAWDVAQDINQSFIQEALDEMPQEARDKLNSQELVQKTHLETVDNWAKDARKYAQSLTPDSTQTGVAGQVLFGLTSEGTNIALSAVPAMFAGPAAPLVGGAIYGALHGTNVTQELKDKGAKEADAQKAGWSSGAIGAVGAAIPGGLPVRRFFSGLYGAGINVTLGLAESKTNQALLEQSNDKATQKLAKDYEFGAKEAFTSAGIGGLFGLAFGGKVNINQTKRQILDKLNRQDVEAFRAEQGKKTTDEAVPKASSEERLIDAAKSKKAKEDAENAPKSSVKMSDKELEEVERLRQERAKSRSNEKPLIQPRDRATADSITQMNRIAGSPDYWMVSTSRTLSQGAPVIAYAEGRIPKEQLGHEVIVSAADKSRRLMQYAVVEADDVRTSNKVDGTPVLSFGQPDMMTAIAGNGRIAGLTDAYLRGTAGKYKAEMIGDAAATGINPEVASKMKHPILVRVMSDDDLTTNIGDLSNQRDTNSMSAAEQAMQDAERVDLSKLEFLDDGRFTAKSVKQFIAQLPHTEQGELVTKGGVPTLAARERLDRAVFHVAFQDASLSDLLVAERGEVKTIVNILRKIAPNMLKLENAGELNFREDLVNAIHEIRMADQRGNFDSVADIANQTSMTRTPESEMFIRFFGKPEYARLVLEPARALNELIDFAALAHESMSTVDIFGGTGPEVTKADLMRKLAEIADLNVHETAFAKEPSLINQSIQDIARKAGLSEEQAKAVADFHEVIGGKFASRYGVPKDSVLPEVEFSHNTNIEGFTQPVTQGKQWEMGSHVIGKENETIRVVDLPTVTPKERKVDIATLAEKLQKGVVNEDTGWTLYGSKSDAKKTLSPDKYFDMKGLFNSVVANLSDVLGNAKLIESHADMKYKNSNVKGIHRMVSPLRLGNESFIAEIFLRDYTENSGNSLATHTIEAINLKKIAGQMDPPSTAPLASMTTRDLFHANEQSPDAGISTAHSSALPSEQQWSSDMVTLSEALRWFKRIDGKSPFESIDIEQRQNGGVYFDNSNEEVFFQKGIAPSLKKIPEGEELIAIHNVDQGNLEKSMALGGLPVPSLAVVKARGSSTQFGAITLIGSKELVNPKTSPVFTADAYTKTFPRPEYGNASAVAFKKLIDDLGPLSNKDDEKLVQNIKYEIDRKLATPSSIADSLRKMTTLKEAFMKKLGGKDNEFDATTRLEKHNSEYQEWIDSLAKKAFPDGPKIRIGRQLVEPSLENYVRAMTGRAIKNQQDLMTYGSGNVRAHMAKQLKSEKDWDKYRNKVQPSETVVPQQIASDALLNDYMSTLHLKWYGDQRNTATQALAKASAKANNKEAFLSKLKTELTKEGITPNDGALEAGYQYIQSVEKEYSDYFEAKPQRAVGLEEFRGAVVPENTSHEFIKKLEAAGLQVSKYSDNSDRVAKVTSLAHKLHETEGNILFQRAGEQLTVKGVFDAERNKLVFTPHADISTFAHEHGHWYVESLLKVAQRPDANVHARSDAQALLKWFELNSVDDWRSLSSPEKERLHERFAHAFEIFLSERVIPDSSLKGLFTRIAQWLQEVYGNVRKAVGSRYQQLYNEELPPLSEEVQTSLNALFGNSEKASNAPLEAHLDAARMIEGERLIGESLTSSSNEHLREQIKTTQRDVAETIDDGKIVDQTPRPIDEQFFNQEIERVVKAKDEAEANHEAVLDIRKTLFNENQLQSSENPEATSLFEELGGEDSPLLNAIQTSEISPDQERLLKSLERDSTLRNRILTIEDENGNKIEISVKDALEHEMLETKEIDNYAQALESTAVECVLRNGGM